MAEIRVQVPDTVLNKLKNVLGLRTNVLVLEEALTMLNWAVDETRKGKEIYSASPEGKEVTRLAMRSSIRI